MCEYKMTREGDAVLIHLCEKERMNLSELTRYSHILVKIVGEELCYLWMIERNTHSPNEVRRVSGVISHYRQIISHNGYLAPRFTSPQSCLNQDKILRYLLKEGGEEVQISVARLYFT